MTTFTRFLMSAPGAFVVTTGLGLMMINLIKVNFVPPEKMTVSVFEINPVVEEYTPDDSRTITPQLRRVITPPSPPPIEHQPKVKPTIALVVLDGDFVPTPIKQIEISQGRVDIIDKDEQPLVRVPPVMPMRAERSGYCRVKFSISPNGSPFDIEIVECSQTVFARNTVKSVSRWKYRPKIVDGQPVARRGIEMNISFNLSDERGNLIPQ